MIPAAWTKSEAWPMAVTRSPETRGSGRVWVTGTEAGHVAAWPASFQRSSARNPRSVDG